MLPWIFGIVPVLFVVRWTALWWGTRQARLRFALRAPLGAIAGVVLGMVIGVLSLWSTKDTCPECRGSVAGFTARFDAATELAGLVVAGSLLALLTAAVLSSITVVVETVRMVRRHERAERDEAGSAGAPDAAQTA
jgi:hypothetical protein